MSDNKRKYLSEFAVGIQSSHVVWIPASEINADKIIDQHTQNLLDACHIYIICKTPKLSFDKESFSYKNGKIIGNLIYKIRGETKLLPFEEEFSLFDGATNVKVSNYPHRELLTFNDEKEEIRIMPANYFSLSRKLHNKNLELQNLEILYIGQAYGDGDRAALSRLANHSTLQKILAQIQYSSPDDEINILTFNFAPYRIITSMDGRAKAEITDYRDIARFHNILDNPLTDYQEICLIEAGLIRYFQPKYNKIYKENFPSQKHKILEQCYYLDFSALIVLLDTSELSLQLFSDTSAPRYYHTCNIELTDPEERYGFFHYSDGQGNTIKMPNVITK